MALTRASGNVAALWLANALPLAIMLRSPSRAWPAWLLCMVLGNLGFNLAWGDGLWLSSAFAVANCLEVALATFLTRRALGENDAVPRGWLACAKFYLWGGVVAPAVAAAVGAVLVSPHFDVGVVPLFRVWFLGDAAGMILVGTLCLWPDEILLAVRDRRRAIEALALAIAATVVLYTAFFLLPTYRLHYAFAPLMLWAAVRFGTAGVALLATLLLVIASMLTVQEIGPFAVSLPADPVPIRVAAVQLFVAVMFIPHALAALVLESLRQAEARLASANDRLRERVSDIADNIPAAISIVDRECRILFANAERCRRTGRPMERLLGLRFAELYSSEDARRREALVQRAFGGETVRFSDEFAFPDGRRRVVDGLVVPHWFGNTIDTCLVITFDISERVELERRLQTTQQAAEIGRTAGALAHDLGNLLTVITLNGAILARALLPDDPNVSRVGLILDAAARGEQLRRRVLAMRAGRVPQPGPVDLARLLVGLAPLLRACVGAQTELEFRAEALPPVHADADLLEVAILNLAANANDAMPAGGRFVLVAKTCEPVEFHPSAARVLSATCTYVRLLAIDTGAGMTPEVLARCLEASFTTKQRGDRGGLGLSSVQWMVEQCGGAIAIDSAPGQGTTVHLYLRAAAGEAAAAAS